MNPNLRIFAKAALSVFLLLAIAFGTNQATAAPQDSSSVAQLQQEFMQLNRIESELIGPFRVRSKGWVVTDSLRQLMGDQAAIQFFQSQLKATEPALRYYAVIGIVMSGGNQAEALNAMEDVQVLTQTGCMMRNQSLKATIAEALSGR